MRSRRELLLAAAAVACALAFSGALAQRTPSPRPRAPRPPLKPAHPCEKSSCYPATGNLVIGRESRLSASSTCGLHKQERYCIVSHLEDRKKCFWCDSRPQTERNPGLNHRVGNVVYRVFPGTRARSWWQSRNGVENVTLQLDLEAEFHFTHLVIVFKTFRPAAMLVERSFDFGKTWRVYRYFAYNCEDAFPGVPSRSPRSLTDVVCESRYSSVAPSTDGEIIFRVLPPSINVGNPYSQEVQNLLKMTNLRVNFTKLHTLGDDLLDNRAEIQEKYYYAVSEMTVRGSCSCYGHASRCLPLPGVESKTDMVHGRCECTHNTKGLNCELCEDFYNDLPWKPALGKTTNACKRCTCNNHATSCHFDPAVYELTAHVSGGMCDDCQHNTMGRNCEQCKAFFYRDGDLDLEHPEVCKPCDCDPRGSLDDANCDPTTDVANGQEAGRCHCKTNVEGRRCDTCKNGFWNFEENNPDGCQACTCNPLGTVDNQGCDVYTGECTCKRNVIGRDCNQCLPSHWGLTENEDGCQRCDCDVGGSLDNECDVITGQCRCRPNTQGRRCEQPIQHFFAGALDNLLYEAEYSDCNTGPDDNAINSNCQITIREPFRDGREDSWTGIGFMKVFEDDQFEFVVDDIPTSMDYDIVIRYEPQLPGNWEEVTVRVERPGPVGLESPCANSDPRDDTASVILPDHYRSVAVSPPVCLEAGKTYKIKIDFGRHKVQTPNTRASVLIDSVVLKPRITSLPFFNNATQVAEAWRRGYEQARCGDDYYFTINKDDVPDVCKQYHTSIGFYVFNGGLSCQCDPTGSLSHKCEEYGGNCPCKSNVVGRNCNRCAPGTFGFGPAGCKPCDCSSIGSLDNFCDIGSGQCKCKPNTYGRQCDECQPGYWNFPNCQQCECHGHADVCDPKTGACTSCRDFTHGHRCDRCIEGYYGDPRLGYDIPCRACPCPGTLDSLHSFAPRCELDPVTQDVICECQKGYAGSRCDVCADNYYGHPEKPGGSCVECNCSRNVDITKPGNCDPHTGKCLQCLHNTNGDNCEVCKSGFFGNALEKTCVQCSCEILGTNSTMGPCNQDSGQCFCYKNVIGQRCDQCLENYWRLASGEGCDPCQCDPVGSYSEQCDVYNGQCACKPGFGGTRCNQCQANYWGDPNDKCQPCECDSLGSSKQQCNHVTGACICHEGIGGHKCDMCARGYLGSSPSCSPCGECFDNWDRIITELRNETDLAIDNAGKIQTVGTTGAYTRDFEDMENNLKTIQGIIDDTTVGKTQIVDFEHKVVDVKNKLEIANSSIAMTNIALGNTASNINLANASIQDVLNRYKNLQDDTELLILNARKLQEANVEGALNLTREAKQRAMNAADDADNTQQIIKDTERRVKNTNIYISRQASEFNTTQKENDDTIRELQESLEDLNSQIPELNAKMCGKANSDCDVCGGAGCGTCGGLSCDQGAVTKADKALEFSNKTDALIREYELAADDLSRSILTARQDTIAALETSQETYDAALAARDLTDALNNNSTQLITELKEFLSSSENTPADVRTLANDILNLAINVTQDDISNLAKDIDSTVSQVTNIESIIEETRQDLEESKELKEKAVLAKDNAMSALEIAKNVVIALNDASSAQKSAEEAIKKAVEDIDSTQRNLLPIESQTDEMKKKANDTSENVINLKKRLENLQKNLLTVEGDAKAVKTEADDVVFKADAAEQKANQLRRNYDNANQLLNIHTEKSANARERAQLLLNQATQLAAETQTQLKQLQGMEALYNSYTTALGNLESDIDRLNSEVAGYLSRITARWIYLEPILLGDVIQSGGSINNDIFVRVDRDFRHIMRIVESDSRLSALTNVSNLNNLLTNLVNRLIQCQNTLEHYMAEKRSAFPRFYFLSDDDLLELLGQVRANSLNKDTIIQAHIKKIFPGSIGVVFGPENASITGMKGQDGEKLILDTPIDIEVAIEIWLSRLEVQMRESLHTSIKQCLLHFEIQKHNLTSYPAQVLCLVQSIQFTENVERSISSHNLHEMKKNVQEELDKYLKFKIHESDEALEKNKLQALILQCYHHLQVLDELINHGISSTKQWEWQKQLRFYVESKTSICACMGLAKIPYTYEFLGTNIGSLVRTELTDQCFLTLTQALHLGMVGNPFGPAGTGKTESVKALGGLLGRLVLVFNCDEGMDNMTMGRLLSGLALCGAWGCFDEFNRLEEKTLSAVIQQFSYMLDAINPKKLQNTAVLNGIEVKVIPGCGIFATMNPASAKYGGRRILPEGLNRLFRPFAMCEPHATHIASALLAAHGFSKSTEVAKKIVLCFEMAKSLLSENHHYDWGLRALKTIIGSCGSAIRDTITSSSSHPDNANQLSMIVQALRINTLSKLSNSDSKRFENILESIFPKESEVKLINENLSSTIAAYCHENNIQINENQIRRCSELYDQLKQRMGVAIVGPPGCGKSFLRNILKEALSKSGHNISQHIICPKALNRKDLLGYIDNDTRQWYDGVISSVSLQVANQPPDVWSWIVCDGDVDPEWIESLNSVLDDNRLLTLPSGWRIQFMKNVNFIFETHDLKYASPATITRMGIILLNAKESSYKEVTEKWINDVKENREDIFLDEKLLIETIEKVLDWADKNSNDFLLQYEKIPLTKQILSFMSDYDGIKSIEEHISISFLKAISCILKPEAVEGFLESISQWMNVSAHAITWSNINDQETHLESFSIGTDFFLMNKRIYKTLNLIQPWIDSNQHFMIFGPPSSGKSLILDYLFKDVRDKIIVNLKCTPILDVQHIVQVLKQKSVVKSGNSKSNGRVVLVLKALHRTAVDKWNTSIVQSFLIQLMQYGGFWEKSEETDGKMQWFSLIPFTLVITSTIEESGLKLSQRLTNSLKVVNLIAPNNKELLEISELYLSNSLSKLDLPNEDKIKLMQLSPKIVSLLQDVSKLYTSDIHYKWTSRDIIQWCQSLSCYKISDVDTANKVIIREAISIFKDRLKSYKEKQALDMLIQKYFGSFLVHEQYFLPKMTNQGLKLEFVDENNYSLSIIKTINHCNSQVDDAFGENGAEFCNELKELVSATSRILSIVQVIAFIGIAGAGRRAASKIVSELIGAKFITISTPHQFFINFKNILMTCGSDCTPEIVLLEESAASDSSVLGVIEALLSKGENVSFLSFYMQEIESMVSQMKTNGEQKTIKKFMQNVSMNLGIILMFDTKRPDLKELFSSFPILYRQCQLFWLEEWSDITLKDVAIQVTKKALSEEQGLNDCLSVISMGKTVEIFSSLNHEYLKTPYRYIIFLKTYYNIYLERKQFLEEKYKRLKAGVSALVEAKEEVSKLKANAAQQQKILAEKQTLANQALNQIGTTMQSASVHKQEMETLKSKAEIENLKLQERKKEIEIELSEVEPVIQEARTAVGEIRPESLSEVRSLRAPPEPVRDVLEGVLRLMGIADTSWHSMKTFLSKRSIKDEIRSFDVSNISQENLRAVEKLLSSHSSSFSEKTAKRASVACAPLAAWVVANVKYANVLQKISPLEAEQRTLSHNLANAESQIKDLSSDLFTVDERVAALKKELNTYTKQATEIEIGLSSVQSTVEKAEELVSKLSKEFQRWNENLSDLSKEFSEICVKSLIMAGFIAYLTNESEENKSLILEGWCKLFDKTSDFDIKDLFITRNNEIEWVENGLSSNSVSLCNGIFLNEILKDPKRGLVPLVIDPNNEGIQWLSNIIGKQPKDIISQHDSKFMTILQHAIRFGKIFVIKDVTNIDDTWSPLLRNQVPLNIGVTNINPAFRLILFSQNLKFLNSLSVYHKSLLSVVNFTPQKQGLIDQLIFNAVKQEEPELQVKLTEINIKKDKFQVQQDVLEVELLTQLSSGNILQNPDLLESLEHTQKAVIEITKSLKEAAEIAAVIKNQCDFYRPVAARVASICLAISSLTNHFPLINITLNTAVALFLKGLQSFHGSKDKKEENFEVIGKYVVLSLLERVLVATNKEFHSSILIYLTHHTFPENIPQNEWNILMCNPDTFIYGQSDNNSLNEVPEWIDLDRKPYLVAIKTYAPELYSNLYLENESNWRKFIATGDWEFIPNPSNVKPFQKVLIAWALKPTKLSAFLTKAISQILGSNQLYPSGNLIATVENWGSISQPILVIGAAGTDPIDEIKSCAMTKVGTNKLKQVWLSQNSDIKESLMTDINWAKDVEGWLVLMAPAGNWPQNEVYQILSELSLTSFSNTLAKIWVVAENSSVPYQFASCCVNVVIEAPTGIKNNLSRTLSVWQSLESVDNKSVNPKQTRLEFSLALAHSVIQQRCSYIPQGWRYQYDFSQGDLEACLASVRETDRIIAVGLCKSFYNGRIHWDQDTYLISTLLDKHFDESVLGHAWKPLGLDISLPMTSKLQDYISALTKFPSVDNPALLSLPNNIQTVHEQIEANNVLKNLKSLTLGEIIQDFNNMNIRKKISPILSLWKKLNSNSQSLLRTEYDFEGDENLSGIRVLTICECETAKIAIRNIHKDLLALYTLTSSSDEQKQSLALSLISDNTPDTWFDYWESGPLSANAFIAGVCERAEIAQKKLSKKNDDEALFTLSLASFLKPECIIKALLWESSRKLSVSPERLTPVYKWDDGVSDISSGKVILKDLWLEGGIWENGRLQPCRVDTSIQIKAPPISVHFVATSTDEYMNRNQIELPVFTSRERKKVIFKINVPIAEQFNRSIWLLNSTALIIS